MRTPSLWITAALVAWAPAAALADYDAREREALAELENASLGEAEREALEPVLERYFAAREDCLEALVRIVAKPDPGEQDAMFVARANMCHTGGAKILADGLGDLEEPTLGALGFMNVLASHEAAFFEGLAALTTADARDRIVAIRVHLADMTEVLDEKWETILDQDETLDERAKRLSDEIRADLDEVLGQAADANPDAAELIAEGVKQWVENPTSPSPSTGSPIIDAIITGVQSVLGPVIATWQATNTRAAARVRAYRSLFASERRVLVMFGEVRDEVEEFLEENDFPEAEAAYAEARSSLDGFVSNAKTSGQSRDASELRDDLLEKLAGHLKRAAEVYGTFVERHREKFFGALAPRIERELLEPDAWEAYARFVEGYGLDAKLRAWQTQSTNYFEVDLSPLTSDARDQLKTGLRAIIDDLVDELEAAGQTYREVQDVLEDEREDLEDELD